MNSWLFVYSDRLIKSLKIPFLSYLGLEKKLFLASVYRKLFEQQKETQRKSFFKGKKISKKRIHLGILCARKNFNITCQSINRKKVFGVLFFSFSNKLLCRLGENYFYKRLNNCIYLKNGIIFFFAWSYKWKCQLYSINTQKRAKKQQKM